MDIFRNLQEKIREETNYEEKTSEKRNLKEQLFRQQLQQAQVLISKNEELPKRMRFDVAYHLRIFMDKDDLKTMGELQKEYKTTSYLVAGVSLVNCLCAATFVKGFVNFKSYMKLATLFTTFGISHYIGMYQTEQATKDFQTQMVQKHKDSFLASNFIKNRLSYDPTRPDSLQKKEDSIEYLKDE